MNEATQRDLVRTRLILVAIAAMNAITGIAIAVTLAPTAAGADAAYYRACALTLVSAGGACGFIYPPAAAIVAQPLTLLPPEGASLTMSGLGALALLAGLRRETRGHRPVDRMLVGIAAFGFAPVVYELLLGQVTLLIAAAAYPAVRRRDGFVNGIAIGIALALAPKPITLAILCWMLFWRRQALGGALMAAIATTALSVVLVGPEQHAAWLGLMSQIGAQSVAGTSALSLNGNLSIWPLDTPRMVLAVVVGVATLAALVRDPDRGLVAVLLAVLVLAPYTGLYALSILLLAVTPALTFAPAIVAALALVANPAIALLGLFVPWALAGLAAAVPLRLRRPGTGVDDPVVPVTGRTTRA